MVEPRKYAPGTHEEIFYSVFGLIVGGKSTFATPGDRSGPEPSPRPPDLTTFPEAFLPASALLKFASSRAVQALEGCLQTGLRPDDQGASHLFTKRSALELVAATTAFSPDDNSIVKEWLEGLVDEAHVNLAIAMAYDSDQQALKLCLFPKSIRSKYERGSLPETYMEEGEILTVVNLEPSRAATTTISVQPVVCSDTLIGESDRGLPNPVRCISSDHCTITPTPQAIDIVSVSACTPQLVGAGKVTASTRWKQAFREAFASAAFTEPFRRHKHAVFVLSNFGEVANAPAGLSGAFIPAKLSGTPSGELNFDFYGREGSQQDNAWFDRSQPNEVAAHLVQMPRGPEEAVVSTLSFTLHRLPRDISGHDSALTAASCTIADGIRDAEENIQFRSRGGSDD
ncbi:MAG: hypothetical protein ACRBN8_38645 [Nannocystales bacterium]